MATFYSSFFSSGLLAPQPHTPLPHNESPSTPRQSYIALDRDTTPTANAVKEAPTVQSASPLLPSITLAESAQVQDEGRPRLRRRRSSLTTAASPLAAIKSSTVIRSANASVQRHSLFTSRSRSGSDASVVPATEETEDPPKRKGIVGRLRSGSVGTALRPRRSVRNRNAPPAPPPPTAPLPALPSLPLPASAAALEVPSTPRRPLTRRAQTDGNAQASFCALISIPSSPVTAMDLDYAMPSSPGFLDPAIASTGLSKMQVDYPSPVDGDASMWGRDEAKEN